MGFGRAIIMWKVEVIIYYKSTDYPTLTRNYFNSKDAALEYINSFGECRNADIMLEDMTPIGDGEYIDGEITWIRKATMW